MTRDDLKRQYALLSDWAAELSRDAHAIATRAGNQTIRLDQDVHIANLATPGTSDLVQLASRAHSAGVRIDLMLNELSRGDR